ncbi:MAG: InlB B-repeat-containing protein [archaeon]
MNKKIIGYAFFTITLTIFLASLGIATSTQATEIETCGELQAIENDLEGNYAITEDIECEGYNFEPIGSPEDPFRGTLNGQYNKIFRVNITDYDDGSLGLFRSIGEEGEVIGVDLVWSNIKSSSGDVGGIAGTNQGLIKDSQVVFSTVEGNSYVGGMVGYMPIDGEIINSATLSTDVSGNEAVGGLLGYNFGGIVNSSHAGVYHWSPSSLEATGYGAGGLVGVNDDESKIANSYANVDVQGTEEVGGLVGRQIGQSSWKSITKNSYSIGPVSGEDEDTVGGFLGYETGDQSECYGNFWNLETSNQQDSKCGVGKSTEEMQEKSTYTNAGWDFEEIWDIEDEYPFLRMKDSEEDPEPVEISNCQELQDISGHGEYKLVNDIDCSSIDNFKPIIAKGEESFHFDGQGHVIENVNINRPDEIQVGIFGWLKHDALVEDVGAVNVNIIGDEKVGGLVGRQSYQSELKDTYATGTVEGNSRVGGLSGYKWSHDITESWANANVKGNEKVGAVVGEDRAGESDYYRKSKTLSIDTEGEGTVTQNPEYNYYKQDTQIDIEATPDEDWYFEEWTGDHTGEEEETTITMDEDKEITANFQEDDEPPEDSFFEIEIISPNDGDQFEEDEEIEVDYFIENTGDEEDSQYIQFRVNDSLEEIKNITLEPGETKHKMFSWSTNESGEYELKVESEDHRDRIDIEVGEEKPEMKAELINPEDGAEDIGEEVDLEVDITHSEEDLINVTFVDLKGNKRMKTYEDIENESTVTHTWKNLEENKTYLWYVILESEEQSTSSDIWGFATEEKFPSGQISVNAGGDKETTVGTPIELKGTAYSHKSRITEYKWDFTGDGEWDYESSETGETEAIYEEPGTYKARLEVTDENNNTNYDTVSIRVREETYFVPRETTRESLNSTEEAGVRITPIYEYDPEENVTKVTYNIRENEGEEKHIELTMDIPTTVTNTIEELRIRPRPDEEETQNLITWEISLASRERTEIQVQKEGFIPKEYVEDIGLNIREIEEPEEPEDLEESTAIGGLVVGELANPAVGAVVLIALIILSLGYYKKEDIKQRLSENLEE